MTDTPRSPRLLIARALLGGSRMVLNLLPARVQKAFEDRFFYAVFNVTRVTNDHYGWRPEPTGDGEDPAG